VGQGTDEPMRRRTTSSRTSILGSCGTRLASTRTLWYVQVAKCKLLVADIVLQPFTHSFPRANIHELLVPDLLHQIIKGTFKDHLVAWVGDYLHRVHGESHGLKIIGDIDRQ
jgi:hypothetical protein